jgi:hypothetical protein
MRRVQSVHASPQYGRAIAAAADLLSRLRLEFVFVGSVARSAWLGSRVERGSLEVVVLMTPEQKSQVAMMANNRGFRVDRDEVEATTELDLIPLNFVDADGEVRVHILVASNALYGRMVSAGQNVILSREDGEGSPDLQGIPRSARDDKSIRIAAAEDLALLLSLAEDEESRRAAEMLIRLPDFDRNAYNRRLVSIGLPQMVVHE